MIYEFRCDKCGNRFIMEEPPFDSTMPPQCDGRRMGKPHELVLMPRFYGVKKK